MKITEVKAYPLQTRLPEYFGASQSWGNNRNATLVEIKTDEGISGYGEAGAGRETTAGQALVEGFKPLLVGEDPFNIEKITQQINHTLLNGLNRGMPVRVISGIDMALWDIVGKALQVPVYKLWGGAVRTQIPVYATGLYYTEAKDQCQARAEEAAMYVRLGLQGDEDEDRRSLPQRGPQERRGGTEGHRPRSPADGGCQPGIQRLHRHPDGPRTSAV